MLLLVFFAAASSPAAAPSRADLEEQARRCRQILKTSIIDFYLPNCVDTTNGGYFESLKGDRFGPTGEVGDAKGRWLCRGHVADVDVAGRVSRRSFDADLRETARRIGGQGQVNTDCLANGDGPEGTNMLRLATAIGPPSCFCVHLGTPRRRGSRQSSPPR
jgi:hypothetical protein